MSEPENPQWLDRASEELREEVPVRPEWRAGLLADIASAPRPGIDDTDGRNGRIVLHPLAGLAAALAFAAIGAGAMFAIMSWGGRESASTTEVGLASSVPAVAAPIPATDAASDVVRFELSAPSATRVALVGSFNRWNPAATPLHRDAATGTWTVSLRLPAGRHVYAFVVDGDVTADPAAPRAADADFGSPNSVVLVSGRSS